MIFVLGLQLDGMDEKQFSTYNQDHDMMENDHCGEQQGAGWWYMYSNTKAAKCLRRNFNGYYNTTVTSTGRPVGVGWEKWNGDIYTFPSVELKIRRL